MPQITPQMETKMDALVEELTHDRMNETEFDNLCDDLRQIRDTVGAETAMQMMIDRLTA